MKLFGKIGVLSLLLVVFAAAPLANAATSPDLGTARTFVVLSGTYTNTVPGTTLNGDLGYTTPPAVAPTVNGTTHVANSTYNQAGTDQGAALSNLNSQPCTSIGAIVALDSYDTDGAGPLAPGTFTPGCYSSTGAMNITVGTTVTLSGTGTYIFRPDGALTTGANSVISLLSGASACDVWWTPTAATSLGANSTFMGTNIDAAGITIGNSVNWTGRALAFGGTISTNADTITAPTCTTASTTSTTTTAASTTSAASTTTTASSSTARTTPGLPNTGLGQEQEQSALWWSIPSFIIVSLALYFIRKKI